MRSKNFIKNNPFRVMGIATNHPSNIMVSNLARLKAYAVIGKQVSFPMDLTSVFGDCPGRSMDELHTAKAVLSSPEGRLAHGLFWFMNITPTDAKALSALAQDGDLSTVRKMWEKAPQDMSALQNQLVCCLLMDPRSYPQALRLATRLYEKYGADLVSTICMGLQTAPPDQLMSTFLRNIITFSDGKCRWWDMAVQRLASKQVEVLWTEAKADYEIGKLRETLNAAKATDTRSPEEDYAVAQKLMKESQASLTTLKQLHENHPPLFSRYTTIADAVCEEILERTISYHNHSEWSPFKHWKTLEMDTFCYRQAGSIRFKTRCQENINIILGRKRHDPLFPNGEPDRLLPSNRAKANKAIQGILSSLNGKLSGIMQALTASSTCE